MLEKRIGLSVSTTPVFRVLLPVNYKLQVGEFAAQFFSQ